MIQTSKKFEILAKKQNLIDTKLIKNKTKQKINISSN